MRTRNCPSRIQTKERKSEYQINNLSSAARVHVSNTVDRLPVISPVATNIGMLIQYSIHEGRDDVSRVSLSLSRFRTLPATSRNPFSFSPRGRTCSGNATRLSDASKEANFSSASCPVKFTYSDSH